jgi:uncharacterized membrane protein YphA (DoxX/SURF4 family)
MRIAVTTARILTGLLFIFSGLVKAIDPRGLAYKMQEFFEAWAHDGYMKGLMESLNDYALSFSIIMITLEVVVGVALLIGWQKKLTTWILLLLILFFTFLTSYVLFSGKIRACGCFGDCIPLTPLQTFSKDIILLILAILLLVKRKYITPIAKPFFSFLCILLATILTLALQFYVLKHLPLVDCLPYKKGNDVLKLRQMPADAIQDKFEYVFTYEKDGVKKEFHGVGSLPDSTWKFSERKQVLVEKGKNNVPLINDFSLTTESGNDTTEVILGQNTDYYLLFIKDLNDYPANWDEDIRVIQRITDKNIPVYIVTSQRDKVKEKFGKYVLQGKEYSPLIFTCDVTAIKTVARTNPTLYKMKGPVVQDKWGWPDFDEVE